VTTTSLNNISRPFVRRFTSGSVPVQTEPEHGHVVADPVGRAYANPSAAIARLRKEEAMRRANTSAAFILAIILLGAPGHSQSVPSSQASANDLARRVITNELKFQDDHSNWMYRLEKEEYGKKQVQEVIETKEGSLGRLLSANDRPLTAKQQDKEDQRVQELMTSRSTKLKLQRALDAETLRGKRLLEMLPDAFVFNYSGGGGNLVKPNFRPNPSFYPPSREARVFRDMKGEMWVDCKQKIAWLRLVVISRRT
jgi:hypothetical protein